MYVGNMRAIVSSDRDPNCLPIYIPIKNDIRIIN